MTTIEEQAEETRQKILIVVKPIVGNIRKQASEIEEIHKFVKQKKEYLKELLESLERLERGESFDTRIKDAIESEVAPIIQRIRDSLVLEQKGYLAKFQDKLSDDMWKHLKKSWIEERNRFFEEKGIDIDRITNDVKIDIKTPLGVIRRMHTLANNYPGEDKESITYQRKTLFACSGELRKRVTEEGNISLRNDVLRKLDLFIDNPGKSEKSLLIKSLRNLQWKMEGIDDKSENPRGNPKQITDTSKKKDKRIPSTQDKPVKKPSEATPNKTQEENKAKGETLESYPSNKF